jgi:hypothetical protein
MRWLRGGGPRSQAQHKYAVAAYFSLETDSTAYIFSDALRSVIEQWRRERPVRTFTGMVLAS